MRFSWDERKRRLNLKDHGLDFVDAPRVFEGPTFTFEDDRFAYDEQRFVTLGFLAGMKRAAVENSRTLNVWRRCVQKRSAQALSR